MSTGKVIAIVSVGVIAIGCGVVGYLFWRKRKKGEKVDDKEEVEYFPYKSEDFREAIMRDDDDPNVGKMDISKEDFAKHLKEYSGGVNFEAYMAEMESPPEDEEDEDDDEDDEDDISDRRKGDHYMITPGEFCNTRTYYEKISLNYFCVDDVVADDRDEIMDNVEHILGNIKEAFHSPYVGNVVYIRNENLEADYEITLVDSSYRKEVLGLNEGE